MKRNKKLLEGNIKKKKKSTPTIFFFLSVSTVSNNLKNIQS